MKKKKVTLEVINSNVNELNKKVDGIDKKVDIVARDVKEINKSVEDLTDVVKEGFGMAWDRFDVIDKHLGINSNTKYR